MKQIWSTSRMRLGLPPITRTPWKQMIWIPGMSRPHFSIASITFFSASSPNFLLGSPLSSKEGGARTTFDFEDFSCSVKNSTTESPEEPSGVATDGLWMDKAILLRIGFSSTSETIAWPLHIELSVQKYFHFLMWK